MKVIMSIYYYNTFYFRFYDKENVIDLLSGFDVEVEMLELTRWMEPPHEGYREHEHESWAFTIAKR
jgi:hypothetical protein